MKDITIILLFFVTFVLTLQLKHKIESNIESNSHEANAEETLKLNVRDGRNVKDEIIDVLTIPQLANPQMTNNRENLPSVFTYCATVLFEYFSNSFDESLFSLGTILDLSGRSLWFNFVLTF